MKPWEFWDMTFTEVEIACKGYEKRMAKQKEIPRLVAAILMNVNRKPNSPPISLEEVMPLYTDKEKADLMSKEEYEEFLEYRKRITWQARN